MCKILAKLVVCDFCIPGLADFAPTPTCAKVNHPNEIELTELISTGFF
jgi:hypothetical protein